MSNILELKELAKAYRRIRELEKEINRLRVQIAEQDAALIDIALDGETPPPELAVMVKTIVGMR